jgi:endonuclease YncB( thermonuclease family)
MVRFRAIRAFRPSLLAPLAAGLPAAVAAASLALVAPLSGPARERLPGPVTAAVEEVVDGDTLRVRARIWLGQELSVLVRLRGIDAPETRSKCEAERALARRAAAYLRAATGTGHVTLTDISGGKYYGRVLARVTTAEGRDVAAALERVRLARQYSGGPRQPWCPLPE